MTELDANPDAEEVFQAAALGTCKACEKAAKVSSHEFRGGCRGCAARSIVRGPHFRRVQQAGVQDRQYRAALAQFGITHEEARAAAAVDVFTTGKASA